VLLLHLPEDHTAATVAEAMSAAIGRLPEQLRRSLTWDQGSQMALHTKITEATGLPIYFCDPHSPWQRGTNENTVSLRVARLAGPAGWCRPLGVTLENTGRR
jgi:IS30 family transposase